MPVTPFHLGAGALIHALAPRRVSFIAFSVANVVTDCETIINALRDAPRWHTFFHTFLGAPVVIALTVALFIAAHRFAPSLSIPDWFGWRQLRLPAVVAGAALGSFTHVVLDAIMHGDVQPFRPWTEDNPFHLVVLIGQLHVGLVAAALAGVSLLLWRSRYGRK
jgi:membrane-bound metal-dependent hydrolase YbcI (DUF457 family)